VKSFEEVENSISGFYPDRHVMMTMIIMMTNTTMMILMDPHFYASKQQVSVFGLAVVKSNNSINPDLRRICSLSLSPLFLSLYLSLFF
jgi:hypothetical protein